jgi:protein-S-isoprenylcysteine O-methyltransferase Ste14
MSPSLAKFKFFKLSAYMPILFLVAIGFSLLFFRLYPVRITHHLEIIISIGVFLFIVGSALVLLSERTRHTMFEFSENLTCYDFATGIFKKSRHPGTLGFLLLFLGFACFLNSYAVLITVILHFMLLTFVMIPLIEHSKFCDFKSKKYCLSI